MASRVFPGSASASPATPRGCAVLAWLHERTGKALTNFKATLPAPQSDLAQETLKDPYVFDFLTLGPDAHVIELKAVAFRPEFAGKMNFYLSAVDAQMRHQDDRPTIGLLLCKAKNGLVVEYALRDLHNPREPGRDRERDIADRRLVFGSPIYMRSTCSTPLGSQPSTLSALLTI